MYAGKLVFAQLLYGVMGRFVTSSRGKGRLSAENQEFNTNQCDIASRERNQLIRNEKRTATWRTKRTGTLRSMNSRS